MSERFFKDPILNALYKSPGRHLELGKGGIPTQQIVERRRESRLITPIPKPKKRGGKEEQRRLRFDARGLKERPGRGRQICRHGYGVDQQPVACQEPAAWIKRAQDRGLAMPVCTALLGTAWSEDNGLVPLAEQPVLVEQLWLLLPQGAVNSSAARLCARMLRLQVGKAKAMQDPHELN